MPIRTGFRWDPLLCTGRIIISLESSSAKQTPRTGIPNRFGRVDEPWADGDDGETPGAEVDRELGRRNECGCLRHAVRRHAPELDTEEILVVNTPRAEDYDALRGSRP